MKPILILALFSLNVFARDLGTGPNTTVGHAPATPDSKYDSRQFQ